MRIRRIDDTDSWFFLFDLGCDDWIETIILIYIGFTISSQDHIATCKCIHIWVHLDTNELIFLDMVDLVRLPCRHSNHLIHRRDQKSTSPTTCIQHNTMYCNICKFHKKLRHMFGRQHYAQSLFVSSCISKKFTIKSSNNIILLICIDKRQDIFCDTLYKMKKNCLTRLEVRIGEVWMILEKSIIFLQKMFFIICYLKFINHITYILIECFLEVRRLFIYSYKVII